MFNRCRQQWLFRFLTLGLILIRVPAALAATPDLDQVILDTQREIKTALETLNTLRAEVETQRAPLEDAHQALSRTVRDKRETLARMLEAQQYGQEQRRALDADVAQLEAECQFVLTALREYRRGLETRDSPAALQHERALLEACDEKLVQAEDLPQLPSAAASLLPFGVARNRARIGGYRAEGTALNGAGMEAHGTFLFLGPITYFADTNGTGGIVLTQFGSISPTYFMHHTPREQAAIAALVSGPAVGNVPLDIAHGDALRTDAARESWLAHIRKGGFVMLPILLVGLLSLILTLWKVFELRGMRLATSESLDPVVACLNQQEMDRAIVAAQQLNPPLCTLIGEALAYRDAPREHLEEILHERILAMVPRLERHLGTLAVFGGVAPLLGLLGTVTGMIHTFDLVTLFGTGEARLLSGGISEALITTKFGLGIAIPVLLVHAFLARRVRTLVGALENAVVRFINVLKIGTPTP